MRKKFVPGNRGKREKSDHAFASSYVLLALLALVAYVRSGDTEPAPCRQPAHPADRSGAHFFGENSFNLSITSAGHTRVYGVKIGRIEGSDETREPILVS